MPARLTFQNVDRPLYDELMRQFQVEAAPAGIVEAFGRKWIAIEGEWSGLRRCGTVVAMELIEAS